MLAWIIWIPGTARAALKPRTPNPQGPGPLHPPAAGHVTKITAALRRVNDIFAGCTGVHFRVCETILLDASRITVGPRSLADAFAGDGCLTIGGSRPAPSAILSDFVTNAPQQEFHDKMRRRCVHLFFVHSLAYEGTPLPEQGSGGSFGSGSSATSYAMVSAGADNLAQTIAHELVHALGVADHSSGAHDLMKESPGEDDNAIDSDQCRTIRETLQARIDRGCP